MTNKEIGILKTEINGEICYLASIDKGVLYVSDDKDGSLKFTMDEASYFKGFEFIPVNK